jgi:transposase
VDVPRRPGGQRVLRPHSILTRSQRCISKLKHFRAVATRYDKSAFVYDGTLDVASIKIWLRDLTHDLPDTT